MDFLIAVRDKSVILETILKSKFQATGNGLGQQFRSVEDKIEPKIVRKLGFITSVRNKLFHVEGYSFDGDKDDFLKTCDEVINYLENHQTEDNLNDSENVETPEYYESLEFADLARSYHSIGDNKKAIKFIKIAIDILPQKNLYWYELAIYHALLSESDETISVLRILIERDLAYWKLVRFDTDFDLIRSEVNNFLDELLEIEKLKTFKEIEKLKQLSEIAMNLAAKGTTLILSKSIGKFKSQYEMNDIRVYAEIIPKIQHSHVSSANDLLKLRTRFLENAKELKTQKIKGLPDGRELKSEINSIDNNIFLMYAGLFCLIVLSLVILLIVSFIFWLFNLSILNSTNIIVIMAVITISSSAIVFLFIKNLLLQKRELSADLKSHEIEKAKQKRIIEKEYENDTIRIEKELDKIKAQISN